MISWWNSLELSGLDHVYLVCFLAGLVLLLLDILLGSVSGLLNLDLGVDVGADMDLDLDMDMDMDLDGAGAASWLPLQPMCILAGVTVFGGVGAVQSVVFDVAWPVGISAALAAILGLGTAFLVDRLVLRPLKNNRADALAASALVGQTAEVTVRIRPGAFGEVSIKNERGILNYRAQWYDDAETAQAEAGTTVGIMSVSPERDTVYVVPIDVDKWLKRVKG